MNIQGWFPLGLTGLISLLSKGLSRVFSSTAVRKHQFFSAWPSYGPTVTSVCTWLLKKNHRFDYTDVCWQSGYAKFVIAFLPRSKCLLISWLQSASAVILEPRKTKFVTVSIFSPILDAMILLFWMLNFKPAFSFSSFTYIKRLFRDLMVST